MRWGVAIITFAILSIPSLLIAFVTDWSVGMLAFGPHTEPKGLIAVLDDISCIPITPGGAMARYANLMIFSAFLSVVVSLIATARAGRALEDE